MENRPVMRLMTVSDIDEVEKIEQACFATPWSRESFYNEVEINQFAKYLVLELNGSVIGYCGLWIIIDEGHITNIAVLPEYRGRKFGEKLLRYALALARGQGANTVTLEVRASNAAAQNLYRKLGFQEGGIRKNYYTDNNEDALVMWVNLNEK
ncbi:ribosomal protein S18-alanine N-acetyltransferase [Bacillus marinisedimentorum]|uniref:ribosomal protein S18-alanine N-acetyltransferase n=1 Tax=Bacillus marinisedimentorum TaxID=1821260 RepID=UPI0008734B45|nr:ribosomal protein S18-alanine N-acetyltransferase [Bacillus marinisedimentorum]